MKKAFFLVMLGIIVLTAAPSLFAQTTHNESEYYYVNTPLDSIFIYRTGYILLYRQGQSLAWSFVPFEWLSDPSGKADMIAIPSGRSWPSFTTYYKDGVFSHVRIYVRRERGHNSWRVVPLAQTLDNYFMNIRRIDLEQ